MLCWQHQLYENTASTGGLGAAASKWLVIHQQGTSHDVETGNCHPILKALSKNPHENLLPDDQILLMYYHIFITHPSKTFHKAVNNIVLVSLIRANLMSLSFTFSPFGPCKCNHIRESFIFSEYAKFSEKTDISYQLILTRTCVFGG